MNSLNKHLFTLLLLTISIPVFAAASKNGVSRMISAAGAAVIFYGAISLYRSFKNKKK